MKNKRFYFVALLLFAVLSLCLVSCETSEKNEEHIHVFDRENVDDRYIKDSETHEYYYSCVCGEKGTGTFGFLGVPDAEEYAHYHEYVIQNTDAAYFKSEATCSSAALYYYSCVCGKTESAVFAVGDPLEHELEWVIDTPATCRSEGARHGVCTLCGEKTVSETYADPSAHNFGGEWKSNTEGHWQKCQNSGCYVSPEASPHVWNENNVCALCKKKIDPDLVFSLVDGTYCLVDYTGVASNINIPSTYNGIAVTQIGSKAFQYTRIKTIIVPSSVTSIGDRAFEGCSNLTTVTFAEGSRLEQIGENAFKDCKKLTSITLSSHVNVIGSYAFYRCESLASITFEGTAAKWKTVRKGSYWNYGIAADTVHCADGDFW